LDALLSYKLDVLGLSETWLKEGIALNIPGYTWSGVTGENKSGKGGGIGFLVKDSIWDKVGEVKIVNSRIIGMFLRLGKKGCWFLQIYAPVNDASQEVKDKFWRELRDEVEKRRQSASVMVMGDMNGRVGALKEDWDIVGKYELGEKNENGSSFLELCRGSDLLIMNG